jgi:hypothetical protein
VAGTVIDHLDSPRRRAVPLNPFLLAQGPGYEHVRQFPERPQVYANAFRLPLEVSLLPPFSLDVFVGMFDHVTQLLSFGEEVLGLVTGRLDAREQFLKGALSHWASSPSLTSAA